MTVKEKLRKLWKAFLHVDADASEEKEDEENTEENTNEEESEIPEEFL